MCGTNSVCPITILNESQLNANSTTGDDFELGINEFIVNLKSGENGDFVVQTESRLFYCKEGFKITICEDFEYALEVGDHVSLKSLTSIMVIRAGIGNRKFDRNDQIGPDRFFDMISCVSTIKIHLY